MTPTPLAHKAVVLDWAGTIVDHGSRAPVEAFREIFRRRDVTISHDEDADAAFQAMLETGAIRVAVRP